MAVIQVDGIVFFVVQTVRLHEYLFAEKLRKEEKKISLIAVLV